LEAVTVHRYSAWLRAAEMLRTGPAGLGLQEAGTEATVVKDVDRTSPLLQVSGMKTPFEVGGGFRLLGGRRGVVRAVDDLSFEIFRGETVGLVGESGCGKTTVGRTLLRLEEGAGGEMGFGGAGVTRGRGEPRKGH